MNGLKRDLEVNWRSEQINGMGFEVCVDVTIVSNSIRSLKIQFSLETTGVVMNGLKTDLEVNWRSEQMNMIGFEVCVDVIIVSYEAYAE